MPEHSKGSRTSSSGDRTGTRVGVGTVSDSGPNPRLAERSDAGAEDAAIVAPESLRVVSTVASPFATPGDEILWLWQIMEPSQQYHPQRATIAGDLVQFEVMLPAEPPEQGKYGLEGVTDPQTGVDVRVAFTAIYRVVQGALAANPSGVNALDEDLVIGQTDGWLFWTPIDLPAGWREGLPAVSAGYHLFIGTEEVDLGTMLSMSNDIWT